MRKITIHGLAPSAYTRTARKAELPDVDSFARRLQLVREQAPERMSNRSLQDVFFRQSKQVEEQGIGSTTPASACGEDDA